jgi:hypothetical protein
MLLRKINQVIRCDPPSLLKVTLQATAVYMFSIIVFIIHYLLGRAASKAFEAKEQYRFWRANVILGCLVSYAFPILFFCYVLVTIKCRGYMPSVTGRTKQLVRTLFYIAGFFLLLKNIQNTASSKMIFFLNIYSNSRYGTSSGL